MHARAQASVLSTVGVVLITVSMKSKAPTHMSPIIILHRSQCNYIAQVTVSRSSADVSSNLHTVRL